MINGWKIQDAKSETEVFTLVGLLITSNVTQKALCVREV
jgi:hypothetical protein